MIYSKEHPGRNFGEKLFKGKTIKDPKDGYFANLGSVSFLNYNDVLNTYKEFKIENIILTKEYNYNDSNKIIKNAFWQIECKKE